MGFTVSLEVGGMGDILEPGYYKVVATNTWYKVLLVEQDSTRGLAKGTVLGDIPVGFKYGHFGEADQTISDLTGINIYNVEVVFTVNNEDHSTQGVVADNGKKLFMKTPTETRKLVKITEEEAEEVLEDGDPMEAPLTPYKLQPENQGRLLWFTGSPGLGKSTSAQLLAREHGYVYYEADCFNNCKNPYIPVDTPDPTMAQMNQRSLKGEGLEARKEAIVKLMKLGKIILETPKQEIERNIFDNYYRLMCEDIKQEKQRIGGDWAVAQCVLSRSMRDIIRENLGTGFVFVLLEMDGEDALERLANRHKGNEKAIEMLKKYQEKCEPAEDDEENVVTVKVTRDMSPQDVVLKTFQMI